MGCTGGKVLCPDNTCGDNWKDCPSLRGDCTMAAPFECENHECKAIPF